MTFVLIMAHINGITDIKPVIISKFIEGLMHDDVLHSKLDMQTPRLEWFCTTSDAEGQLCALPDKKWNL